MGEFAGSRVGWGDADWGWGWDLLVWEWGGVCRSALGDD